MTYLNTKNIDEENLGYLPCEFRCRRISTSDAPRSGRLVEVTTEGTVNKIPDIVLADRRVKVREIAENIMLDEVYRAKRRLR